MEILRPLSFRYSNKQIASEYTSSPVEQPGTQIRMGESGNRSFRIRGNTSFFKASKRFGFPKEASDPNEHALVQLPQFVRLFGDVGQVFFYAANPS